MTNPPVPDPAPLSSQERHFRDDDLDSDLKGQAVRGGAVTLAGQAIRHAMQLAGLMVLGRLLTPADFGLVAMVRTIMVFVGIFEEAGLSTATLQKSKLTHGHVSVLFWANVALGAAVMAAVAALSPAVAWFYGRPELVAVTLALSVTCLLGGLSVQHMALLRRQMRFEVTVRIVLVSHALGLAASIGLALAGAGYWALVSGSIVIAVASAASAWIASGWRPSLPRRGSGARSMLKLGGHLTGFNVLNYFSRNLDNIMIGKALGAASLGLYDKAYDLLLMPMRQITGPLTNVAIRTLSRLQDDPKRYRRYYRRAIELIVFFGMPLVALMFVAADEAVLTFLGPQWIEAASIFRWLAPAAFTATTNVATGWVYISFGRTDRQFRYTLIAAPLNWAAMAVGLYLGGVIGVAAAVSIQRVAANVPSLWFCYRGTPVRLSDYFAATWRSFVASITAGALNWLVLTQFLLAIEPVIVRLVLLTAAYGVLYLALFLALPGGPGSLRKLFRLARELRSKKAKTPARA